MRISPLLSLLGLGLAGLIAGSCSPGVLQPTTCTEDQSCRDAFGPNFACGEEGLCALTTCTDNSQCRMNLGLGWECSAETSLCEQPPIPDRCISEPPTLLTDPAAHKDDLIIGSIFDHSAFDIMVKAARLPVIQVNERDGFGGRAVGIIQCTNEEDPSLDIYDPEEATEYVGRILVERYGVQAIVGPATSGRAEVAYNALSPLGAVVISPSATSPALTDIDGLGPHTDEDPGLFWRTAPPDSLQGQVIAEQMISELNAQNVAVIHEVGAYGEGLAEVFLLNFEGGGREAEALPFTSDTDLATITASVGAGSYDQVLMISSETENVVNFLNAASSLASYESKGIFLTDGARDAQLLLGTAGNAENLYPNIRGTVPANLQGIVYDTFAAAYSIAFDGENPADFGFSAHAFDAGWLALIGHAWGEAQGVAGGLGVAQGLRKISSGSQIDLNPNDWNSIRASFADAVSVDVRGASGALDYDDATGETTAPILVWTISADGLSFVDVDCVDFGSGESLCPDLGGDDDDSVGDDDDSAGDDDDSVGDDDDSAGDDDDSAVAR